MREEWLLPAIDLQRCTLCGACVQACSASALSMGSYGPYFSNPQNCTYCTDCEAVCPQDAISCSLEIRWEGQK